MFRNYLTTALRNLARNRLYAAITILGLAVAFAVAILVGQFVRNEFTYDRWIPGHGDVYKLIQRIEIAGQKPIMTDAPQAAARRLEVGFPHLGTLVRLALQQAKIRRGPGDAGAMEWLSASVDPDFFKVLPLPALAGDPATALQQPDTVVLTRRMARRYFGRDRPIGQTLEEQDAEGRFHAIRVTAVLDDFPANTNLGSEIFSSGRSAWSRLTFADTHPLPGGADYAAITTFARLAPGIRDSDLRRPLDAVAHPYGLAQRTDQVHISFHLTPLDDVHWLPAADNDNPAVKPSGDKTVAYGIAAVAALMVLVAAINFVTLMTARAARRGVEVGVRKVTGAGRRDLIIQFIGEALIQVAMSVLIAAALAEVLVKPFDALVRRDLAIDFIHDPALLAGIVIFALAIGGLASVYPALVLSSFRPQAVLKGGLIQTAGSPLARAALVSIQFSVLVGLILTTTTIYRQTQFALTQGIGASDSKLIALAFEPCKGAFPQELRKLPGVSAVACSSSYTLLRGVGTPVAIAGGGKANFWLRPTDFGALELAGVRPSAGRLFARSHGEDGVLADPQTRLQPTVVINETAAHALGYADPHAAIGKSMPWTRAISPDDTPAPGRSEIIGVVPDMPETLRARVDPTFYFVGPKYLDMVSIKLTGHDVAGTMRRMDALWKRTGGNGAPVNGVLLSRYMLNRYADLVVQGEAIAICAGLAILISCLGLFALAAFMTERRTKEIGIRKALGAGKWDVMALLLWQFTIPVLCAVATAAPLGFLAMHDWLSQFVYRVSLSLWTFALAGMAAVVIAWLTVAYQSYVVARAKPAGALQYE